MASANRISRRFGFKLADGIIHADAQSNDPEKAEPYEEELALSPAQWERFGRPRPNDLWEAGSIQRGNHRVTAREGKNGYLPNTLILVRAVEW